MYAYKIKQFLLAFALGMTVSSPWDGCFNANGGYIYNRGIQMYRFPNSDVQKSVIFEGIKKRLKIV